MLGGGEAIQKADDQIYVFIDSAYSLSTAHCKLDESLYPPLLCHSSKSPDSYNIATCPFPQVCLIVPAPYKLPSAPSRPLTSLLFGVFLCGQDNGVFIFVLVVPHSAHGPCNMCDNYFQPKTMCT